MKSILLIMLAETNIHAGAGTSDGLIDLPVAREAVTDYPFVPGSGVKGALRAWWSGTDVQKVDLFGKEDDAGGLLIGDARLALLPVRSLTSAFRWTTCPHLLERLARDAARTGIGNACEGNAVDSGRYYGAKPGASSHMFLEERQFECAGPPPSELLSWLQELFPTTGPHASAAARLADQLAVLSDDDFAWFARNGLPVHARNKLNETKRSENLWYEESLPSDTVLYVTVAERRSGALEPFIATVDTRRYLQIGGNETVGMGWVALRALAGSDDE